MRADVTLAFWIVCLCFRVRSCVCRVSLRVPIRGLCQLSLFFGCRVSTLSPQAVARNVQSRFFFMDHTYPIRLSALIGPRSVSSQPGTCLCPRLRSHGPKSLSKDLECDGCNCFCAGSDDDSFIYTEMNVPCFGH